MFLRFLRRAQQALCDGVAKGIRLLREALELGTPPSVTKASLEVLGLPAAPIKPLTPEARQKLKSMLAQMGAAVPA